MPFYFSLRGAQDKASDGLPLTIWEDFEVASEYLLAKLYSSEAEEVEIVGSLHL